MNVQLIVGLVLGAGGFALVSSLLKAHAKSSSPSVMFEMMAGTVVLNPEELLQFGGEQAAKCLFESLTRLCHSLRHLRQENLEARAIGRIMDCVACLLALPQQIEEGVDIHSPKDADPELRLIRLALERGGWVIAILPDPDNLDGRIWRIRSAEQSDWRE